MALSKRRLGTTSIIIALALVASAMFFPGSYRAVQGRIEHAFFRTTETQFVAGTYFHISATGFRSQAAVDAAFAEINRLNELWDDALPGSDVNRLEQQAGSAPVRVAPETIILFKAAKGLSDVTGGAFDITVGPLVSLWRFDHEEDHSVWEDHSPPDQNGIADLLAIGVVDYRQVVIDEEARTVFLTQEGMSLAVGGIAKGMMVDAAMDILEEFGVGSAIIDAGGDIAILGTKPDAGSWRLGIRHPRNDGILGVIESNGVAIATSGDYERHFSHQGQRYHHLLDPVSGQPAAELAQVTIYIERETALSFWPEGWPTALADALATGAFIMGPDGGMELTQSIAGVEAVFVTTDGAVFLSEGFENGTVPLTLEDPSAVVGGWLGRDTGDDDNQEEGGP